jgi:hypothetical protein
MYQIVLKPFGRKRKMTKKQLYDFAEIYYEIPKDQIEGVEIEGTENEYIYTLSIRG